MQVTIVIFPNSFRKLNTQLTALLILDGYSDRQIVPIKSDTQILELVPVL